MNYLSVQDLGKSYGIQTLFKGLNFGVDQGQKVALVARNGTGKTTILRALAGVEPADTGEIVYRKGIQVAFLKQESDFGDAKTVFEAIYESENPILLAIFFLIFTLSRSFSSRSLWLVVLMRKINVTRATRW